MINTKLHTQILTVLMIIICSVMHAHPTGNLITVGKHVLWSYINPIDDPDHHACVMIWNRNSDPEIFIQSEHAASDFMLYNNQDDIYIIERRHVPTSRDFEIRILKTTVDSKPRVIWNWFTDDHRIGEGGFFMISDDQIVFCRYPDVYYLKKGGKPEKYFEISPLIKRIRAVENNQILLLGDEACFLAGRKRTIIKQWNDLIDHNVEDSPLNRNQLFDADYKNGELLLAYWGNRSFKMVDSSGARQTIVQQADPLTPHWVAFWGKSKLLFSSKLVFDGSTPKPHLVLFNYHNNQKLIWTKP